MKQNKFKTKNKKLALYDRPLVLSLFLFLSVSLSLPPSFSLPSLSLPLPFPHTQSVGLLKKIWFKWWFGGWDGVGWPDFRKGECSRLPAQHKKMTFDQASVCIQWECREWKYQKMSEVGGLAYRFSGVQSSSQEQLSWGNYNREKRVFTVSVNQLATAEEKQDEEKCRPF